jgi:hypothetical protein
MQEVEMTFMKAYVWRRAIVLVSALQQKVVDVEVTKYHAGDEGGG